MGIHLTLVVKRNDYVGPKSSSIYLTDQYNKCLQKRSFSPPDRQACSRALFSSGAVDKNNIIYTLMFEYSFIKI